ncbi:MAG: T9SS type A sorting domain-containing protein, partial [Thermoflexibacter sp.]|nr:T9SS type A sorting domain-containing protein [Thermoflexibacter sp.]
TWLLSPKDNNNGFSNQIAKYDKNGSLLWQFQLPEKTIISGIKANDLGDVLVSGELFSNMTLNGISGYFLASIRDNSFFINPNYIKGSVYEDINNNCQREPNEKGIPNVIVKVGDYISTTNKHGDYQIATTTGNYKVSSFLSSKKQFIVKNICKPSYSIFFPNNGETRANIDFPLQVTHCSYLSVDIASNRRRRCFRSYTMITYQNEGFGEAQNVQLKVIYPKYVVPIHSSKQWESQQDSLLIFNIGTLKAGQTGRLVITDSVVCGNENIRGLTQCTKAIISPASSCIQLNPAWDKASIAVDGYCDGKSAHFTIKNIGIGDMKDSTNYRIFFDVALVQERKVKLKAGESLPLVIAAKGRTVRVEADQVPNHPTESEPNTTVDACGRIVFNILAQSPVRQLPQDNKSEHAQTSCMEIIDSYDPNDKQVNPIGVTEKRFIKNTDLLEYLVRFQNTGSDTAYTVVIRDTLSKFLDVSSLAVGASSHSYTWSISGKGNPVLTFTFNNINLPHAKRDEEGSNGFVKFKIRQIASNPIGTKITNRAGIYFDFNSPIITNETLNEIGDPIVKQLHKPENLIDINICDALAVPTAAQAGSNQTVSTNQAELSANVPEKGIGVWKVVSGTGRIANPNEAKTRISNLSEGENVLEWTVSLCGRVSSSQVKITYTRIVSISSLGNMLVASEGDSYQWYKDGQAIPGATQRTYTPTVAGVYSVVVTKSGIATTSASITITGIEESLLSQQVHLYPNPTQHQVIVEFSFAERGNLTLNLLDYLGRKVHTENLLKTTPTLHYSLTSSHLPQGLYLLQFEINGYRGIKRMVKE